MTFRQRIFQLKGIYIPTVRLLPHWPREVRNLILFVSAKITNSLLNQSTAGHKMRKTNILLLSDTNTHSHSLRAPFGLNSFCVAPLYKKTYQPCLKKSV